MTRNGGRRELPKRRLTSSHYDVLVADEAEVAAALAAARLAAREATLARLAKDQETIAKAEVTEAEAKARLDACTERITFIEIDPVLLDSLMTANPYPDDETKLPAGFQWPFIHALAAASAVEYDLEAEGWAEWSAGWSVQNWAEFAAAVKAAQTKTATAGLPKG